MRSSGCSTTGSRRTGTILELSLLLASSLLLPAFAEAAELSVVARAASGSLAVDAEIREYAGPSVIETVHEGLKAEVRFSIQVYREETGVSGLLGDTLVAERRPHHIARWDPFGRMYVVEHHDGRETSAIEKEGYLKAFLSLHGFPLPADLFDGGGSYYLMCRAEVVPVRLVPALGILSVFTDRQIQRTDWVRVPVSPRLVEALQR